ncbi:hypothetical protein [Rufibacter tibetensis]|nr:hypothetical protein [Rufibacter tibetensis]
MVLRVDDTDPGPAALRQPPGDEQGGHGLPAPTRGLEQQAGLAPPPVCFL